MKVGILTFHHTFNAGAYLQTWASVNAMKKLGLDVEVIDYLPWTGIKKEYRSKIISRRPHLNIPFIFYNYRFIKNTLPLSSARVISDNYSKAVKLFAQYDVVLVGSDTVFEIRPQGSAYAPPAPNIYYLTDVFDVKKVGMAVSADKSDFSLLDDLRQEKLGHSLSEFSHISSRDAVTNGFIKQLGVESDIVFDPTFSVDFCTRGSLSASLPRYILINTRSSRISAMARLYAEKRKLVLVSPASNKYAHHNMTGRLNPFDWVELHNKAEFIITDRFHGTIFGLKANVPVLSLDDAAEYEKSISKKEDMLFRLGLDSLRLPYKLCQTVESAQFFELLDALFSDWNGYNVPEKCVFAKEPLDRFILKALA